MNVFILYYFISGLMYTAWLWESKDPFIIKIFTIILGFMVGWYIIPVLIGRTIAKIYKDK